MPAMAGDGSTGGSGGMSSAQAWMGGSGIFEAFGHYQSGRVAKAVGRMRRRIARVEAKQSVAAAQRRAIAERKNAELLASRAIAVAAAGGGGADDPTVLNIVSDIDAEGAYRAAVAMYEGEEQARKLRYQGELQAWEGDEAYKAGKAKAIGSLVETGAKVFAYG